MKKTLIIIAAMFAFLSAHAQVNHIISTLFEPDSCTLIQAYDTSKWDLNHDGVYDVFFRSEPHPQGGNIYYMSVAPNWKYYKKPSAIYDTVLVEPMVIDEALEWYSFEHMVLSPFNDPPFYAFRHQAEDGIHYGWMYIHEEYYNLNCIRGMGYCTLPDTPIQWGQTELWGVEENDDEGFATLHPNPTTGMVTVKGENLRQAFVTNLLGQQVLSVQGEGDELQIDMTALPAGIYFVTVTDENGRKCVRKAVRE